MKKVLFSLICLFAFTGCSTVGKEYVKVHEDVFGCPPVDMPPSERSLDAEGPKDECGKPVYVKPDCPSCQLR